MKRYVIVAIYKGVGYLTLYNTNSLLKAAYRLKRLRTEGKETILAIVDTKGGGNA